MCFVQQFINNISIVNYKEDSTAFLHPVLSYVKIRFAIGPNVAQKGPVTKCWYIMP